MQQSTTIEDSIMWTKPAYEDLRIGFEVTMYFSNR
ncbi:MAG: pyrroloquinoline quinone precursor peptide PqqA [Marinobacter sp.]|nr:pyrroloquinoline quinone precursor peptide PqqA [Marinobacter sp.]